MALTFMVMLLTHFSNFVSNAYRFRLLYKVQFCLELSTNNLRGHTNMTVAWRHIKGNRQIIVYSVVRQVYFQLIQMQ